MIYPMLRIMGNLIGSLNKQKVIGSLNKQKVYQFVGDWIYEVNLNYITASKWLQKQTERKQTQGK